MARIFLYIVAAIITLAVLGMLAYRAFEPSIIRFAFVPGDAFSAQTPDPKPDYSLAANWVARPDQAQSPAKAVPPGFTPAPRPAVDVFYVGPTTYLQRARWNAPLADAQANERLVTVARHQASVFNGVGDIWMPRYRQATFGSFLTTKPDGLQALNLAYGDVLAAFDVFIAQRPAARPFILAGHSQGSLHLLRLLKDRITGTPLKGQLVAAYVVGWPVSIEADLPALPDIPMCQAPEATGCLLSWQSFGVPADTKAIRAAFDATPGLSGKAKAGTRMVCVNPLRWWADGQAAAASANLGALPFAEPGQAMQDLQPAIAGATCKDDGFLHLSSSPGAPFRTLVTPGENYHVYDYTLVWANVRANAERRVEAALMPR
jgi:hypothetical protein